MSASDSLVIKLYPNGTPNALDTKDNDIPTLTAFLVNTDEAAPAVMICPGGGYAMLAIDHEGFQIANWFNELGINAFVLKYRIGQWEGKGYRHPDMLNDAQRGFRIIRNRAKEWNINPNKMGVLGFSAGGHLASTLGTHFDNGNPKSTDPIEQQSCLPNFMILGYPVISLNQAFTHQGSRRYLLGATPDPELVHFLSNETQVSALTPPTFIFHTDNDGSVPVENALVFYMALKKFKIPAEMHIYEKGKHGVGFAPDDKILGTWPDRLKDWLQVRGIL